MKAYWVARARINDPAAYKRYTDAATGVIAEFGGRFLARGGRHQVLEGSQHYERFVVAEFPSFDQAVACHASKGYQDAAANRKDGGGDIEIVIVEAVE